MEVNLTNINTALMKCEQNMQKILPDMYKAEMSFNSRYYTLLQQSMAGSAPMREADAKKAIELEDIYETYHALKLKMRMLYSEKETLTVVSSNLRTMSYGQ